MSAPIFNHLSQKFTRNIYDSFKGRLRLAILARDFEALGLNDSPLNILDIGAGQGQFAGALQPAKPWSSIQELLQIRQERVS